MLVGHVAKSNPVWKLPMRGEALAIFSGPEAYVTPSAYPSKKESGKVVPTWNYVAVHAHGVIAELRQRGDEASAAVAEAMQAALHG